MPTPIATTARELRQWLIDHYDPELAAQLVVAYDGIYCRDDLIICEACGCNNAERDTIVDGICEPCRESGQDEADHQRGLMQMVRRL